LHIYVKNNFSVLHIFIYQALNFIHITFRLSTADSQRTLYKNVIEI